MTTLRNSIYYSESTNEIIKKSSYQDSALSKKHKCDFLILKKGTPGKAVTRVDSFFYADKLYLGSKDITYFLAEGGYIFCLSWTRPSWKEKKAWTINVTTDTTIIYKKYMVALNKK